MATEQTLLCWHSERWKEDVLINSLKLLAKKRINISRIMLLKQATQEINADKIKSGIAELDKSIEIENISIEIDDPTRHSDIYERMQTDILPKIKTLSNLHVNISPGTPAMHAVWLILHAGGQLPRGTKLWNSQKKQKTGRHSIKEVAFPITTYLSEIKKFQQENQDIVIYNSEPKSDTRKQALENLKRYSRQSQAFLVIGERGTGKTRIIETIGKIVKAKPMQTLACGTLDSNVVESIIFGHTKGSFTGASTDRAGLLKEVDGGVLFLDEVQDLPKTVQRKLVRVLQGKPRKFRPMGSDKEISVSFDLICASNLSLEELSETLDPDFFDRISILTMRLPPLRECREDLEDDWQNVWKEVRISNEIPELAPISKELKEFLNYSKLNGNLRDLQRLASLIMISWGDGDPHKIIKEALDEFERMFTNNKQYVMTKNLTIKSGANRDQLLQQYKKEIARAAKEHFKTWKKAAKALECNERTLRNDFNIKN